MDRRGTGRDRMGRAHEYKGTGESGSYRGQGAAAREGAYPLHTSQVARLGAGPANYPEGRGEKSMKYAFYTGCVSRGGCPELYTSANKVAGRLGIEMEEMKDVACNGACVLPQYLSHPIYARTVSKAERIGLQNPMA